MKILKLLPLPEEHLKWHKGNNMFPEKQQDLQLLIMSASLVTTRKKDQFLVEIFCAIMEASQN